MSLRGVELCAVVSAGCSSLIWGGVAWSCQESVEITCAVRGNADNLFSGIDRTRIEEKQRRVGRDERVEIDQRPTIQSDECARIEVRIERYANDVAVVVDAQGDTREVTRERSQILDARLFAPQIGDGGSVGP